MIVLGLFLVAAIGILTALVVVGGFLWIRHSNRQRRNELALLAERIGFRYVDASPASFADAVQSLRESPNVSQYGMHDPGAVRQVAHVEGDFDGSILRLGNVTELGDGLNDVTVAVAEDPRLDLPIVGINPRTPLGRPRSTPIPNPDDPEFDAAFWVCGPDAAGARRVLSDSVRRQLLARKHFNLQTLGMTCAVTRDSLLNAQEAETLIGDLRVFLKLLAGRKDAASSPLAG